MSEENDVNVEEGVIENAEPVMEEAVPEPIPEPTAPVTTTVVSNPVLERAQARLKKGDVEGY